MWFPELFNRMEKYGGSPCNLGHPPSGGNHSNNNNTSVYTGIYLESFLVAASNLPGNILTFMVIEKIRRKLLLCE